MNSVRTSWNIFSLSLLWVSTTFCGTWVPNPNKDDGSNKNLVSISVTSDVAQLNASTITIIDADAAENGYLEPTKIVVVLSNIMLYSQPGVPGGVFTGPYYVDLLQNTISPQPDPIELEEGVYDSLGFSYMPLTEDSSASIENTEEILGYSVIIEGTWYKPDSSTQNVAIKLALEEDIILKNSGTGIDILNPTVDLIIAFRVPQWLSFNQAEENDNSLDFSSLGSGSIVLDSSSVGNAALVRDLIGELIEDSTDHGVDSDGDGLLSQEEDEYDEDD